MDIVRFIFLTALKRLGLIFLGLLAAKAVSGLSAGQAEKRLTWLQRGAYALIVGLAVLNAYNLGNDIAAANYAWAGQRNLAQSQPGKAYSNALLAVELRPGVTPYWEIVRDWFPFLVILLMYYSLWGDATHLLVPKDRDAVLIALDQKLFGFQASVAMQRYISQPLTAWMDFAYTFHVLNVPIVGCFVYLRRPRHRFREMMAGVLVVTFIGLIGYLLVPAVGPMYTLRDQYTVALRVPVELFNRQIEFMDYARIQRDVFPSLHVGISFVVWLYAYRNSRRLFWILSPLILSLFVFTIYLRYHYLIDVVAGLVLAPLAFRLANWMFKRAGEVQLSVALPLTWMDSLHRWGWPRETVQVSDKVERP